MYTTVYENVSPFDEFSGRLRESFGETDGILKFRQFLANELTHRKATDISVSLMVTSQRHIWDGCGLTINDVIMANARASFSSEN